MLLEAGANTRIVSNKYHYTPLHVACVVNNGNINIVKELIKHNSSVNFKDSIGSTPLHYVCYDITVDIFKYLISVGADVTVQDNFGSTPIDHVYRYNSEKCINVLIKASIQVNSKPKLSNSNGIKHM